MDVEGFMALSTYPQDYAGMFSGGDGKDLLPAVALSYMCIQRAMGRKVIPMSAECGKPCAHEGNGCEGFDYAGGGCPGHFIDGEGDVPG